MMMWEQIKTEDFLLGVWHTEESSEALLSMLDLQELYLPFCEKSVKEHRKREWLATRVLLKELLGEEWPIEHYPDGAPYLPGSPWQLSISHTRGYVAVMLSKKGSVGIDIEYRGERVLKIRNRFMNPQEEAYIDPAFEADHTLIHWCAKETLFKIMRQREVDFREQLHVNPFHYSSQGVFTACESRTPGGHSYQINYQVTPDYILTYCIDKSDSAT